MSGAFLSPSNRDNARERADDRLMEEYDALVAESSYRWATGLLVAGMVIVAVPQLGLRPWIWYIVGALAVLMVIFAVRMMWHGRVGNGVICLLCALAVLPGWVFIADDAVSAGQDLTRMILQQWKDKFGD
ncbi:MAG TPA: hypothetical protein VGE29_03090 [Prosthecobacter sp.]